MGVSYSQSQLEIKLDQLKSQVQDIKTTQTSISKSIDRMSEKQGSMSESIDQMNEKQGSMSKSFNLLAGNSHD